jgi:TPR repeat protein
MLRIAFLSVFSLLLAACATTYSPQVTSELQQGQRDFNSGYYKRAMHELLPLACDGNAEAQYAVGYMYYYGYGVTQDIDVGGFWIERSAKQHYKPAIQAKELISRENTKHDVSRHNSWGAFNPD